MINQATVNVTNVTVNNLLERVFTTAQNAQEIIDKVDDILFQQLNTVEEEYAKEVLRELAPLVTELETMTDEMKALLKQKTKGAAKKKAKGKASAK